MNGLTPSWLFGEMQQIGVDFQDIDPVAAYDAKQGADRERERQLRSISLVHASFLTFDARPDSVDIVVSRFALHPLPDFWKQVALLRLHEVLRPGGLLFLRDVVFSFSRETHAASLEHRVCRMPERSGFSRDEFETRAGEECSTSAWILEGLFERACFDILERVRPDPEYAEYLCSPRKDGR